MGMIKIKITGDKEGLGDFVSGEISSAIDDTYVSGGPLDQGRGAPGIRIIDEIDLLDRDEKDKIESDVNESDRVHPSEGVITGRWGRTIHWKLTGEDLDFVKMLRAAWKNFDKRR